MKQNFQATETEYQKRVAESMGLDLMSGRPALEAMGKSVLAAPTNVAGKGSNMVGIAQYQLRASLDGVVAAAGSNVGNVITGNLDEIVHGQTYYQYMAEQATLAADIGTAAIFMIPMVVATGQVKLLGSALGSAVSQHAPNTTVQSANQEMAKANDAENRDMNSVVAGYSTATVMQGIEANNAAIAALAKMDHYNDFNKGQIGQQMQQIGSTAGFGSELNSAKDFQNVLSGGKFQGVQSAANMKSLGREFESDQDFKYGEHTTGRALARTLGNDATAKTIGSARGLIAGDFFDKDGNLTGGREGNLYTQGLENQARISANQTAGVGKLGELTRSEMNAIQYGAQAGALNQIAQGNSLRRVFGTDAAGFESNYKAMANTQADMQNITARETTRSAREHFGAGLQGGGSNGISYAHAAHSNADLKHDQFAGTAQGYDDAMAEAKAKGIEGSPFQAQVRNDTKTQGNTTTGNIKQGIENMKNEAAAKAGQDFVEGNSAMLDSIAEKANQNAAMKSEIMNREMRGTDAGTVSAGILKDKYAPIMKENEAKIERMSAMFNERKEALERSAEQAVDLDPNSQQKALDQMAKANTAANVEQQLERTSSYQAAIGTGALNPSTGTFSQNFRAGASYNAAQSYANVLATSSNLSNTAALSQQMQDMGLNQAQISNVLAGGTTERGIRLAALTGQAAMRGSFQGRSFMLNASSDGQYNGSFDSSLNVRGGYNVDMGTATAAAGYQAGGVSGMRAVGITQTGWNFATETASNVMMFAPGGGFAKGAARLGVINPSSRYHMGIGQYRNMMSNKATSAVNQGASIGVNSTIPNGKGGYVNLNELF